MAGTEVGSPTKDIFAMAAMGLKNQLSRSASKISKKSFESGASFKVKPKTGKERFKGLALKAIQQEHGDEGTPVKRHDPIGMYSDKNLDPPNRYILRIFNQNNQNFTEFFIL